MPGCGGQTIIRVEKLTKQVVSPEGTLTILHDIDFCINKGEAVAVVGASGSGKSTLLGLMAGLDVPTSGQVHLSGIDIFAKDEDSRANIRREKVGFVFQSFQLLPHLTALENVMLPLELSARTDAREQSVLLLSDVGLQSRMHHYPKQLSGGEQQRVAIARAFVSRPEILFADEPTGNLDQVTGEKVIELLFDLNQSHQATLVLVTHDESLANRCSRSLSLVGGQLK
ncbi:MAG: ABC transporter ATP-binding protein [Gammaproteobacteria bacterium]